MAKVTWIEDHTMYILSLKKALLILWKIYSSYITFRLLVQLCVVYIAIQYLWLVFLFFVFTHIIVYLYAPAVHDTYSFVIEIDYQYNLHRQTVNKTITEWIMSICKRV